VERDKKLHKKKWLRKKVEMDKKLHKKKGLKERKGKG
jgi:hypothetical protein